MALELHAIETLEKALADVPDGPAGATESSMAMMMM
jgi:hypothetical protein